MDVELECDSIWLRLQHSRNKNQMFVWPNTISYNALLSSLCIDSKNTVVGPRWSSEVPRFAVSLKFTPLTPKKTSNTTNFDKPNLDTVVNESQFYADENIAEMDSYNQHTIISDIYKLDDNSNNNCWIETTQSIETNSDDPPSLSESVNMDEVLKIVNSLPDLSVLESEFIIGEY